jgi:branched-chain amino acid transport system substrate-binding protein
VRIRSQMERLGIDAVFQGTSGIVSDAYIEGLGALAEGTIAFREGAPAERLPGGDYFLRAYREQGYSDPPEAYGPFAFAATDLIIDAVEKVGPNRRRVTRELNATRDHQSVVGTISFDEHGQNMVPIITKFVVQDGKWTIWEDSEYASGKRKLPRPR